MTSDQLHHRWIQFAKSNGIAGAAEIWHSLSSGYAAPDRHYHNWNHIGDCLAKLDHFCGLAQDPIAIELAIWFHDVIYDSKRSDNEVQSAKLAKSCLQDLPLSDRVVAMIAATSHGELPREHDAALLCDIDLSILGADSMQYDGYATSIRSEYAWVNEANYRAGRARVLASFLERQVLYSIPQCRERWETNARSNIRREISRFSSK